MEHCPGHPQEAYGKGEDEKAESEAVCGRDGALHFVRALRTEISAERVGSFSAFYGSCVPGASVHLGCLLRLPGPGFAESARAGWRGC